MRPSPVSMPLPAPQIRSYCDFRLRRRWQVTKVGYFNTKLAATYAISIFSTVRPEAQRN